MQFVLDCDRSTVKHALQNTQNDCYQRAPNSISAGAPLRTSLGELTALTRPPSWFKGPTSKGRGGKGAGKEGRGGREKGRGRTRNGGNGREGVRMPEEGKGRRGGEGREKKRRRRDGEGIKVRTPPPSIPAYASAVVIMSPTAHEMGGHVPSIFLLLKCFCSFSITNCCIKIKFCSRIILCSL